MAAAKKNILKLDTFALEDNFFENLALIGISSDVPVYNLCHNINEAFALEFERKPKMDVVIGKKKEPFSFAVYQSKVPRSDDLFTLYKLRIGDIHLLPDIGNVDYIWMLKSDDAESLSLQYLQSLRNLAHIQFATLLDKSKIKNIEYLIL